MRQRRILEMSPEELRAVTAIVLPGRKGDELKIGEMQEMCIKWLFANGLSINHVFELHDDDDGDLFCVMRNSEACWCCPKASKTGTLSDFDRGPIGDNFKRTPSPTRRPQHPATHSKPSKPQFTLSEPSPNGQKIGPITVQPTIVTIPDKPKEEEEQKQTACGYCKRECGLCIVNLCSQF
ncbi:unnamed protein product [Caenorhabditis sp. 36 PRJEB53466]|nr:unnamed protein product [Caenorhabditis sp. 36 PRJEB53466]